MQKNENIAKHLPKITRFCRGRVPCKLGRSAYVKGRGCLGKRIRAAARINVGGRAYYCGREAALLRPTARDHFQEDYSGRST